MSPVLLAPRSTQFRDTRHRHPQIGDQSVGDGVAPAVYGYVRALLPGLHHEWVGGDVLDLTQHVEFAEAVVAGNLAGQRVELARMLAHDFAHWRQPVVDQPEPLVPQHSPHAAATIVTHDQNVADP